MMDITKLVITSNLYIPAADLGPILVRWNSYHHRSSIPILNIYHWQSSGLKTGCPYCSITREPICLTNECAHDTQAPRVSTHTRSDGVREEYFLILSSKFQWTPLKIRNHQHLVYEWILYPGMVMQKCWWVNDIQLQKYWSASINH